MRFNTLNDWLNWQETLHPSAIELGLERPQQVLQQMQLPTRKCPLISVAGTNGKGSSVAMLESIFRSAGYRVGCYTSPHLLHYNERIRLDGEPVSDAALCAAFERVDFARKEISLTYFEFGTLAAIDLFSRANLDVIILEVGMGGRLDAVNILDADVALVTAIDVDHVDWLGSDREQIGLEKAGIFRAGRAAVCSDSHPPQSLLEHADKLGISLYLLGRDYNFCTRDAHWSWSVASESSQSSRDALPMPVLRGQAQLRNAAGVLMVLELLADKLPINQQQLRQGLLSLNLPGRFQVFPGVIPRILDVAHNPQSAAVLASNLAQMFCTGRTHGVFASLADKDIPAVVAALGPEVDTWHVASLDVPRGANAEQLERALHDGGYNHVQCYANVTAATEGAEAQAGLGDRVVVFGSFYTVAEAMSTPV